MCLCSDCYFAYLIYVIRSSAVQVPGVWLEYERLARHYYVGHQGVSRLAHACPQWLLQGSDLGNLSVTAADVQKPTDM